jgi:ABC-type multidrug transport system fused ATPase/permease subunit
VVRTQVYESIASVERASNKLARVANRSTPLMEALGGFAITGVFIYGGYRVLVLNLPPGELFSFITAFLLAYEPAKRIARLNIELHNALTGVQMLFDVLDVPDRKPARPKPDIKVTRGAIEFDQVSFAYRAGSPVLRQLSFVAKPGGVTAFVGPSGGGKSTIFNLVLALYTPSGGAIRLDAHTLLFDSASRNTTSNCLRSLRYWVVSGMTWMPSCQAKLWARARTSGSSGFNGGEYCVAPTPTASRSAVVLFTAAPLVAGLSIAFWKSVRLASGKYMFAFVRN